MELFADALKAACGLLIPAMFYAWYNDDRRIKPIAMAVSCIVFVLLVGVFFYNDGYSNGRLAQFELDADSALANFSSESPRRRRILAAIGTQKDATKEFVEDVNALTSATPMEMAIVKGEPVPSLVMGLLLALLVTGWIVIGIESPKKPALDTNKGDQVAREERDGPG
jgi:hypothetical protein